MKIFKKISLRIAVIILGFVIGFVFIELGLRIINPQPIKPMLFAFDPQLGFIHVPNQKGRRSHPGAFSYTYSNNSYGLRANREYALEKTKDYRIIILGDSFTYGIGVDDNQTLPFQIEIDLLNLGYSVEVINAGSAGKGTDYALKFFQTLGYKFKPDLTILCFTANDFIENEFSVYYKFSQDGKLVVNSLSNSVMKKKDLLRRLPLYNWLLTWSHLANFMKSKVANIIVAIEISRDIHTGWVYHYSTKGESYSNEHNIKLTAILIEQLRKVVQAADSELIFFYLPYRDEVEYHRQTHKLSKDEIAFDNLLISQQENLLSLTSVLAGSPKTLDQLYCPKDPHPTPAANAIMADFMSSQIKEHIKRNLW